MIAIGNDSNNNMRVLLAMPGANLAEAADRYFGSDPYDEQESTVLDSINKAYFDAYSWNVTTHVIIVDMVRARACRMNQFKKLRCDKWCVDGLPINPNNVLIGLFTGTPKTDLESLRDMETIEQPNLDLKNTIAELEAYLPTYLS